MPGEYLRAVARPDQTVNPLFNLLGLRIVAIGPGRCTLELPFRDDLVQGGGVVAGGLVATLLDEAMAHAALASNAESGRGRVATIAMDVRYYAPARPGTNLRAEAAIVRAGRRVLFAEASAWAGSTQVAAASAQFMTLDSTDDG